MFRQRGWPAVLAIWIVLAFPDSTTGGVPSPKKNPRVFISLENRQAGREIVGKNSWTLGDGGSSGEINRNQFELGSSRVQDRSDTPGIRVDLGAGEAGIKKNLKNEESDKFNDFYSSGSRFIGEKLAHSKAKGGSEEEHANKESKQRERETKIDKEDKWKITQVGSTLNEPRFQLQRSKWDDCEEFHLLRSGHPGYQEDSEPDRRGEYVSISNLAGESTSTESTESGPDRKSFEPGIERAYLASGQEDAKLKDKLSRERNAGVVLGDDRIRELGVLKKELQPHPRYPGRENTQGYAPAEGINVEESLRSIATGAPKAQSLGNDRTTTESSTANVESDFYGVSSEITPIDDKSGEDEDEGPTSPSITEPMEKDNNSTPSEVEKPIFDEGESGTSGNGEESKADSQEGMKCIGKTKFNSKPAIGLSAVSHPEYIGEGCSDSNMEGNPVPKYESEGSYVSPDAARDMRREGDAAVAVADELAYSDAAEIRESAVNEIGARDDSEIALLPASLSEMDKSPGLGPPIPQSAIRSGSNETRENVKSGRIHHPGEMSGGVLQASETLSELGEINPMKNLHEDEKRINNDFEVLENRDTATTWVIGSDDHVPRESLRKIAAISDSGEQNDHLGIIETLDDGYPRSGEKIGGEEDGDRNGMTTMLSIRAWGTFANSFADNQEESKRQSGILLGVSPAEVNASEQLSEERNLSKENKGGNSPTRIRIPNFLSNQGDPGLDTMSGVKSLKTEFDEGGGNDTDKFQFLVENSAPIRGGKIERNGDMGETRIDARGKSSGNLSSGSQRDGKVIMNSKFIVQHLEMLSDKVNRGEAASFMGMKKNGKKVGVRDMGEKPTAEQAGINLWHVSPLSESNADGNATGDREIDINRRRGQTTMTGSRARTGTTRGLSLTLNLLAGEKNDGELRGEENRGGVSRTMETKKSDLFDKLWGGKAGVGNLSTLDISGYGFITQRYFELNAGNNDRAKSFGNIATPEKVLRGKQTLAELKYENPKNPEPVTEKSLIARLSEKYLASKNKRAMKSSIVKKTIDFEETTTPFLLEAVNEPDTATDGGEMFSVPRTDLIEKIAKNNTRLFSRSSSGPGEIGTTPKIRGQSVRLFPVNGTNEYDVSTTGYFSRLENSTEINVSSENKGSLFDGDNVPTEDPGIIGGEGNQTHSNVGTESMTSRKVLGDLISLNADLVNRDILSSLPENLMLTEMQPKTTLDVFEAVTQGLNPQFSFNQTDPENATRVPTTLNQWPVKHSAVVEGDLVLGGLMMVHEREDSVTCGPVMPQGGVQALEAMLYTLDRLNEAKIIPGVKIGAHILDDCDKDTYGLEMAVDFIKGSISNIDGAEYHCNKTAVRKVISGVVGAASSVTSIQVANLLRLFRIPQVSFFSTSPELSNKQRFEYFSRTIPSDHYQVKAMVDIVRKMNWSYVSIIYEESNYGIKAFEELEELLAKYDICIAVKEKLVKDSGVAKETAYDNIVQKLLTKPRARGCIIFGSDQEVAGVMRAVRRCNATGAFSWIGSDGWSARGLVSDGNEPEVEGTLSVQPQANPVKGFEKYFLDLTVENNRRNPWFVEFWEDHFQCRYPNASWTPYNQKYTKPCTTKERLTKQNTAFEDQLQFVSDAVTAFAHAFRDMHGDLCGNKSGLCDAMKPTKGTDLLKYLRKVDFEGLSGDKFKFDKNGDGPARYNIIHFKQASPGKYKWVRVGEYVEGELRLNMSEIQFRLGHPLPPESVCSLPCEVGQAKKYVEGESCCWHCFNCTQYQVRHPLDETQCIPCPQGRVPDETHSNCRDIPEEFLRPESGWAIGAMSFSATGILVTLFVGGVFLRHNDTPVVKASGRELSYVLLTGILLCYLVTFALVLRPNNIVCGIQRFGAGFCFTVVYAALLTKTNRISRIFNAGKHSAKRPSFISPRSQLIICSGLMGIQVLINGVWMIIDPAKAMHHYPTREDNLLVCSSYIDASYMIAFTYPIILIVICTVYAVLTRKIPEAFNESKHIGFTMYTTCVIWLAFVPLYFGTGNHVALRITSMSVTISLSASVTIACLFSPKLYIILIRPERNVRQSMMPARYSTTKSSAVTGTNASSMMAAVTLTAATCDQNKAVKRHVTTTIDCSTQSEHYEMEVKGDRINGKAPGNFISRSTQTPACTDSESNPGTRGGGAAVSTKDITGKEIIKDSSTLLEKQANNLRIGNGPVSQKDGAL